MLAACKGRDAETAAAVPAVVVGKYIPEGATIVAGIDVAGVVASSAYTGNRALIETGEAKRILDAAAACSVGLEKWQRVTFGMDTASRSFAAEIQGDGLGDETNLACIAAAVEKHEGRAPWKVEHRHGGTVLAMSDGGVAFVVDRGTVVLASKAWVARVKDLVAGEGRSAFGGSLAEVIGRADTTKTLWVAGGLPPAMVAGTVAQHAKDVAGSIDLSHGVALAASVGFASADEAAAQREALQQQFDGMKGLATTMGVPQTVLDSVRIEQRDTAVHVAVTASDADIHRIQEAVLSRGPKAP